jgi:UDP-GlcNAc:undecaprenyl-phosphate/decaprenyl-phosphate GlcNAc-1-phosphate transferase
VRPRTACGNSARCRCSPWLCNGLLAACYVPPSNSTVPCFSDPRGPHQGASHALEQRPTKQSLARFLPHDVLADHLPRPLHDEGDMQHRPSCEAACRSRTSKLVWSVTTTKVVDSGYCDPRRDTLLPRWIWYETDMSAAIAPIVMAWMIGATTTFVVRGLARRFSVVAPPQVDRWHPQPTPLLGGVAIWLATMVTIFVLAPRAMWPFLLPIACAATGGFAVGLIDDFIPIKPASKLTGQIVVGCLTILSGWSVGVSGSPALDALISLAWFVGISNAFNLLDNMDGLCAGVAAIAAIWVCASLNDPREWGFLFSAALAGACVGFLLLNYQPATIFMGDSGSLCIGASLAVLTSAPRGGQYSGPLVAMAIPVLLLLIPIFDTLFVAISRQLSLRSAAVGGRDHTSHRLVALGFSERQAVLLLWVLAAVGGFAAAAIERTHVREANAVVGLLAIGLALLATQLARVRVYEGTDFARLRDKAFTPLLIEFTYKRRVFEVLLDLGLVIVAYYLAYIIRFDRDLPQYYHLFVASLPVVIACQLVSFFGVGVYRGMWHFFTTADLMTYVKGVTLGTVSSVLALVYLYRFTGYSRSVFLIDGMTLLLLLIGSRYAFRVIGDVADRRRPGTHRVAIYGAGEGGALLVRELRRNPAYDYRVLGFFDDDYSKAGKWLDGLPVFGGLERVPSVVVECGLDLVIVSTRKLTAARVEELRRICFDSGTEVLQFNFELKPLAKTDTRESSTG